MVGGGGGEGRQAEIEIERPIHRERKRDTDRQRNNMSNKSLKTDPDHVCPKEMNKFQFIFRVCPTASWVYLVR